MFDILLSRLETTNFIVTKLWRKFISPNIDTTQVQHVADTFRTSSHDIKVALRELLLAQMSWAP